MDLHLEGKTAFIMASSSGIGKAIATELANEGANVMITSRTESKLQAAKEDIEQTARGKVSYVVLDQKSKESIQNAVQTTREEFGPISILVNNSGGPPSGKFEEFNDEDWQSAFELTLFSYIRVIREVLPDLKETNGRILNNTSISVKEPLDDLILSNVFRKGVAGLSKSLSKELAGDNILVNTIGAGLLLTDRVKKLEQQVSENTGQSEEDIREESVADIPLGRIGQPEELAKVAAFLVSGANTYVTGQTILADGGVSGAY